MISLDVTSKLPASFKNVKNVIITILVEFMCKAKSFAIAVLVFFHLLFSFPLAFLDQLTANRSFNELLPRKRENEIRLISLGTRNKVCVTNIFEDVICDGCDPCHAMCFILFTVTSIHNIDKYTKNQKIDKTMEGDTEYSRLKREREREIDLISLKKN